MRLSLRSPRQPAASGAGRLTAAYVLDPEGEVTGYSEYQSGIANPVYSRQATYNSKGEVTGDIVSTVQSDNTTLSPARPITATATATIQACTRAAR